MKVEAPIRKYVTTRNTVTGHINHDQLSLRRFQNDTERRCSENLCKASITDNKRIIGNGKLSKSKMLLQAKDFFDEYFGTLNGKITAEEMSQRWSEVEISINKFEYFELTLQELKHAVQYAWRNATKCVGKIWWETLTLRDCRYIQSVEEMFDTICEHLKKSINNGRIKNTISVFPQKKTGQPDLFRIWNRNILMYAGYQNYDNDSFIGNKSNIGFTEFCQSLGWKGKHTMWDVLPIVLSGPDQVPQFFELPEEIILKIRIEHPDFPSMKQLNLEWFGLAMICDTFLECAGQQFPATAFSAMWTLPEIATRNFLDEHRYNLLKPLANVMKIDTSSNNKLWKDRVNLELGIAVSHSFKKAGCVIIDQHSLAEKYLEHYNKEHILRGGCPSDWVYINGATGSLTPIFHQEMISYQLSPSFEAQPILWKSFKNSQRNVITFNGLCKAVMFVTFLFSKHFRKRKQAHILYGSVTGKSKRFAMSLNQCLNRVFRTTLSALDDETVENLEKLTKDKHQTHNVFILASTTGDGDAPFHAENFKQTLENHRNVDVFKGLNFAVFALGSSMYENYCEFGKFCHKTIKSLGGRHFVDLGYGDDQTDQETCFQEWAKIAILNLCSINNIAVSNGIESSWPYVKKSSTREVYLHLSGNGEMEEFHRLPKDSILDTIVMKSEKLSQRYLLITLGYPNSKQLDIKAGDHIQVYPENDPKYVCEIMERLEFDFNKDEVQIWEDNDIPPSTIFDALSKYLCISNTPTSENLLKWTDYCCDLEEKKKLQHISFNIQAFNEWEKKKPNVLDLLNKFPSLKITAKGFLASLKKLIARTYSVSSIEKKLTYDGKSMTCVDLLIELAQFEAGPFDDTDFLIIRKGICSSFLEKLSTGSKLLTCHQATDFFKESNSFTPVFMIAAGSGIAPFRALWQQRLLNQSPPSKNLLFFGCREESENLFHDETKSILKRQVAYSREENKKKQYVQELILKEQHQVFHFINGNQKASVFICGRTEMAKAAKEALIQIFINVDGLDRKQAIDQIKEMKRNGKLREEHFG